MTTPKTIHRDWGRWYKAGLDVRSGRRHLWVEKRSGCEGISWDALQQIKNEMVGPDVTMVEYYPPAGNVVDEINRRHLWEMVEDDRLPLVRA